MLDLVNVLRDAGVVMPDDQEAIAAGRAFTRFYTNKVGALRGGLPGSRHPLPEARVLYELGHAGGGAEVAALKASLDMDAGQLSRLLARLDDGGLVARERSDHDARKQVLRLTAKGRREFARLDRGAVAQWSALLAGVDDHARTRLVGAMGAVREVLGADDGDGARPEVTLRAPGPGDLGWIVERHGALYHAEFGWGAGFEALCARVVADFAQNQSTERFARGWIATAGGAPAGCVLCVDGEQSGDAKLRLLLVEPWARGLGVRAKLIDAVVAHARERDADRVVLWTNHPLTGARRLYERRGFRQVAEEPHSDWGIPLRGQVLQLDL
jgi:DNA-binding MarR family transcriptional regulator/N-acetylglutamate synthase-like GNAT family acetyltransferase